MSDLALLSETTFDFPPVSHAMQEPNGLLAVGGDLQPQRLLNAYAAGIFPWYEEDQPILWWSPDPRMCLTPDAVIVSRSLRKTIRKQEFSVTMDSAFERVISLCGQTRAVFPGTWINPAMQNAYCEMHRLGHAHSVEVWQDHELAGGLYGIAMGRMFFGESMFSLSSNASKVAFVYLCRQLQAWDFRVIDCQMPTDHLFSLGATEMSRDEFQKLLHRNRREKLTPGRWTMALSADEI